jgi:hypothetical protein
MAGFIITLVLAGKFAALLRERPRTALLILGGDALRWILATAMLYSDKTPSYSFVPSWAALMPVLIWTSLYAALCWALAQRDARRGRSILGMH